MTMSASPRGADAPTTETPRKQTARGRAGSHGPWRGRDRLKLLGARRGAGALLWSGLAIPAAYELDVFASGPVCTIQGNVEGDFTRLRSRGLAGPIQAAGVRLRLDDGREMDIELVDLAPSFGDFTATAVPADAAAIVQRQAP